MLRWLYLGRLVKNHCFVGGVHCQGSAYIITCRCVRFVSFLGSTHSYLEHSMLCVAIFPNISLHGGEHSGSLDGPINLLLPQDCSLLNNLLGDVGL